MWKTGGIFDLDRKKEQIRELEEKTFAEGFWNDQKSSEAVIKELNILKDTVKKFEDLELDFEDIKILVEFYEAGDESVAEELESSYTNIKIDLNDFNTELLLDGPYDNLNAIVTVHSGAGGTEACDWAEMLFRMFTRWVNKTGYKYTILDSLDGDGAGYKSITILVEGAHAYGYLKSEKGVHRLVRISPFDANKKRHTSFASVDVMPEIDDNIEVVINQGDLRIDTYRASGAGGQHVNMTDSAVRITHFPTGVVVTCQNERSQLKNRDFAMKVLKSKLFEIELKKKEEDLKKIQGEQSDISWGNQIRSYVFQPYTLVKDHRMNFEVGNVQGVMDGDIDSFISAYLKWSKNKG